MLSLKGNPREEYSKDKAKTKSKAHVTKYYEEKKDKDSMDMESLQRIVKKISNDLIDLKKQSGEGYSSTGKI
jgi:predicted nucleotide-binding protein (sugar kinase/HSP70/actin superfamily)